MEHHLQLGGIRHCSFEVLTVARDQVTIRDLNLGGRSVTNDAEHVVEQLRAAGLLEPGRRLYYFDSMGAFDEIVWEDGAIGFRPARDVSGEGEGSLR